MRVVVALVALLYVLAAFYGYFWWSERHTTLAETQTTATIATAPEKLPMEQLRFPDVKSANHEQLLVAQQLTTLQARFAQLELKQDNALKALQTQIDQLKQQQANAAVANSKPTMQSAPSPTAPVENAADLAPEGQVTEAKQRLAANLTQLNLKLEADTVDLGRQSSLQQKVDDALNQAELTQFIQGRTECGQAFCKLDLQGKAADGVDVLQILWEQQIFPEATEVLTIPKPDGSGWLVYVAEDGQSLPKLP